MELKGFYNMDCMEGMKQIPDKYFDLAIVDPPYGIDAEKGFGKWGSVKFRQTDKSGIVKLQHNNILKSFSG